MTDSAQQHQDDAHRAGQECLEAALDYLARGWSVLGICPPDHVGVGRSHGKTCASPGKRPWPDGGEWKRWQEERPDAATVKRWWQDHPMLNVGVALGPVSGLVRIDIDGPAGETSLLELSGGDLPPTLEFTSPRPGGGRGLLYAIPAGAELRTTVRHAEGEEVRLQAKGSQTVLPPSRHVSGGRYRWADGRAPGEIETAPCPAWLLAALSAGSPERPRAEDLADGELICAPHCDETLTSMAGTMRRRGFSVGAIQAALLYEIEDGRVETQDGKRAYDQTDAERIARSVGRYKPDEMAGVTIKLPGEPSTNGTAAIVGLAVGELEGVEMQPVHWLVPGRIPLGKLVLIAGDGGNGKSTLTLSLAADLSRGLPALGQAYDAPPPCDTLLACCEDDYSDTVVPRLLSHGADLRRVHTIEGVRGVDGKTLPFSLACYEALEAELERRSSVRLVVIDPAGAFIGRTGIDDYKDSELRALLGPLSDLAARRGVTILLVKHLIKGATVKAIHKVGGSAGYANAVRAAFIVCPDPNETDLKLLLAPKFNLGPLPQGLAYRLVGVPPSVEQAVLERARHLDEEDRKRLAAQLFRVEWMGTVETTADDALAGPSGRQPIGTDRLSECEAFVAGLLGKHPEFFPSSMIDEALNKLRFSARTYDRVRKILKDKWVLRSWKVGDRWFVGPRKESSFPRDDSVLQPLMDSWVTEFSSTNQDRQDRQEKQHRHDDQDRHGPKLHSPGDDEGQV